MKVLFLFKSYEDLGDYFYEPFAEPTVYKSREDYD